VSVVTNSVESECDRSDITFAMGLIVAQGSFTGDKTKAAFEMKDTERWVLESVQWVVGGQIYGPHHYYRDTPRWRLIVRRRELPKLMAVVDRYLPAGRRREKFEAWKAKYGLSTVISNSGNRCVNRGTLVSEAGDT
jgi:hypothetical protein